MTTIGTIFAAFLTIGSIVASLFVLTKYGMNRRGMGLLFILGFFFFYGLRTFNDIGGVEFTQNIVLILTVAAGISLLGGLGLLISEIMMSKGN